MLSGHGDVTPVLRRLIAWVREFFASRPEGEGRNVEAADQRTYDSWDHPPREYR